MTSPLLEVFEEARRHELAVNKEGAMPGVDELNRIAHEFGAYGLSAVIEGPGMTIAKNLPSGVALQDGVFYNITAGEFLGFADALRTDIHCLSVSGSYAVGALTRSHSDNTKVIWTPVADCDAHDVYHTLADNPLYWALRDELLQDEIDTHTLVELCAKTATLNWEQFLAMQAMLEDTAKPTDFWSAIYPNDIFVPSCPEFSLEQPVRLSIGPGDFFALTKMYPENMYRHKQVGSVCLTIAQRPSHVLMQDAMYIIDPGMSFERSISTC